MIVDDPEELERAPRIRRGSVLPEEAARPAAGSPRLDRGLLSGHVGPRVRLLRNLLMSRVTTALAPFGLSHGALSAMALIAANARCSQMQIARDLGMEKSAVATIVDELARRRLVARSRSREDRRRNALSLTPKGERTMQAMHAAATAEEGPMERALDPGEFDQFLSLLDRAYEALAAAQAGVNTYNVNLVDQGASSSSCTSTS